MIQIHKFPRTRHIRGSRLQTGDEDLTDIPFSEIAGQPLIVTEKVDGANCGISFDSEGQLLLQSRGHYLSGGPRERQFDLFKTWANMHSSVFLEVLESRYLMYGEWLYAKHTAFYDALPHYFLEFDILDRAHGIFLDSESRAALRSRMPMVHSAPVLHQGPLKNLRELQAFIGPSSFISQEATQRLSGLADVRGLKVDQVMRESDLSGNMEGLYIRIEQEGMVKDRFKFVRAGFRQAMMDSESHWMDRPMIANQLLPGLSLFETGLP